MHTKLDKLGALLNDIEQKCDPAIGSKQCIQFMLECLSLIEQKLPSIAVEALTVAKEYLAGRTSLESVSEMRLQCWQYLRQHYPGVLFKHSEVNAIRAVIFLLHAQEHPEDRNIVDHLSFFLMLVNDVEPHRKEEETLLPKYFAECLKTSSTHST